MKQAKYHIRFFEKKNGETYEADIPLHNEIGVKADLKKESATKLLLKFIEGIKNDKRIKLDKATFFENKKVLAEWKKTEKQNGKTIKLYYHKTDGGAEYLMDTFLKWSHNGKIGREGRISDKTKYVVRIDGNIEKDAELNIV